MSRCFLCADVTPFKQCSNSVLKSEALRLNGVIKVWRKVWRKVYTSHFNPDRESLQPHDTKSIKDNSMIR